MQFADNAGPDLPDQDFRCPLPESMDTVAYVDEQRMSRSDCTDTHKSPSSLCIIYFCTVMAVIRLLGCNSGRLI